ncbi:MAG: MFS transporter [Deltaproteobacteria bacterium]|nr:MFS transporter [Deltaproteobacteria bacterium]
MKKIFYGWWIVWACFTIAFLVSGFIFYGFTAFFEPLIGEFGWTYTQVSFASSIRGMEMGLLSPFVGFLVDRYGSRNLLLVGVVTTGMGLILMGLTQSLAMFYGAVLILAFGAGGCTSVVTLTAVANWFSRNSGRAFGIMASGFGASGLLIPPVVWLVDACGWRWTLVILGLFTWAAGIPLSLIVRNRPEDCGLFPDGDPAPPPRSAVTETGNEAPAFSFLTALKDRSFIYINVAEGIRMMILAALAVHIMPYLSSINIDRTVAGLLAAAMPVLSILGRYGFGWLGDIVDKRYVSTISFVMMTMGISILAHGTSIWSVYAFLLLFAPGFGGGMVMRGAMVREFYGRDIFGKLIGIVMGTASIGGIIGPTLTGWIFDSTGSYYPAWIGFVVSLLAAIALILLVKKQPVACRE